MNILGIETSCDETAAAVVKDGNILLSNVIATSLDLHKKYGGVVPEIAARSHIESIIPVIEQALADAETTWDEIDGIAVTKGPGLIGSLIIGVLTARTLAIAKNIPLYSVNHVAAHPYATFITDGKVSSLQLPKAAPEFPALALIVSGGHTQLVLFKSHGDYKVLGQTSDDAIGEAFDKVAKIIGLPYPGGPSVAKAAESGDAESVKLPRAKLNNPYSFSYSGLKTAVLRAAQEMVGADYTLPSHQLPSLLSKKQVNNIAASFQKNAIEMLLKPLQLAISEYAPTSVIVAGGVAANQELRRQLTNISPAPILADVKLCTDNAAMIAAYAFYNQTGTLSDASSLPPDPSLEM